MLQLSDSGISLEEGLQVNAMRTERGERGSRLSCHSTGSEQLVGSFTKLCCLFACAGATAVLRYSLHWHVQAHTHAHTCTHTHTCTHARTHTHIHTTYTYANSHTYTHARIHNYTCTTPTHLPAHAQIHAYS